MSKLIPDRRYACWITNICAKQTDLKNLYSFDEKESLNEVIISAYISCRF